MVTPGPDSVNKPFYCGAESSPRYSGAVDIPLAASGVDWSEVHAVRLLGLALGALILLWAIRRMFGGRK